MAVILPLHVVCKDSNLDTSVALLTSGLQILQADVISYFLLQGVSTSKLRFDPPQKFCSIELYTVGSR